MRARGRHECALSGLRTPTPASTLSFAEAISGMSKGLFGARLSYSQAQAPGYLTYLTADAEPAPT